MSEPTSPAPPTGPLFGWIRSGSNPGFRGPMGRAALRDFWPRHREHYAGATMAELREAGSTLVLTAAENLRDGGDDPSFLAAEQRLRDEAAVESLARIGVVVPISGGPDIGRAVVIAQRAVRPSLQFPAEEGDELRAQVVVGERGLYIGSPQARWSRSPTEAAPLGVAIPVPPGTWTVRVFVPAGSAYRDAASEAPSCIVDLWPA